jgi:O-antigen/teichoic acid export membrane protein
MNRSSVIWSAVRNWGPRFGTIITFFVLARILDKTEIGMFAAAYALVSLTELFADNGFGDAIVRTQNVTHGIATSILILNFALALAIYALLTVFSTEIGNLLGVTGIESVLQLVGLSLVLNSFGYVPQALLRKEFQFKRLAFRSLASTVVGALTGLAMAFLGFGVYSMVGQLLATTVINVVFLWYPVVLRPAAPQFAGIGHILHYAFGIFGSRVLNYASLRMIEIVIPIFFGPAALALYIMGSRVPAVIAQMLTAVMVDVNLPHLSRLVDNPPQMKEAFYSSLRSLSMISAPAFISIAALSPEIARICFGSNGIDSELIMFPAAILGAAQSIGYSNEVMLNAWGLPRIVLRMQVCAAVLIAIILTVLQHSTVFTLVTVYVCCHIVVISIGIVYGSRKTHVSLKTMFGKCGAFFLASFASLAVVYLVRAYAMPASPALLRAIILAPLFVIVYVAGIGVLDRDALRSWLNKARKIRAWKQA